MFPSMDVFQWPEMDVINGGGPTAKTPIDHCNEPVAELENKFHAPPLFLF